MMSKASKQPMEAEMDKSIKHLDRELIKIRTGRAHTALVEDLQVSVYGQPAVALKGSCCTRSTRSAA